jgi:hypothetical protein
LKATNTAPLGTKSGTISFFELHRANNPADTRHPAAACWISCWKTSWQEVGKKKPELEKVPEFENKFLAARRHSHRQRAPPATSARRRP